MTPSDQQEDGQGDFLPTTYLAVLSLIGSGARYGYEINQILEGRGYRNWVDIRFSSVYKGLVELEKKGLIRGKKTKAAIQPSKKTYSITARGERVLGEQLVLCLSNPPKANSLFDLGMSGLFMLTKNQAIDALQSRLENLDSQISFLKANTDEIAKIIDTGKRDPKSKVGQTSAAEGPEDEHLGVVKALFERPLVRLRGERRWLQGIVKQITEDRGGFSFKSENKKR